jgi:hypothetical protein
VQSVLGVALLCAIASDMVCCSSGATGLYPEYVTERADYHRACYISNMAILVHEYTYIYLCHAFLFRQGVHTNGRFIANDEAIPPASIEMTPERVPKVIAMATWGHLER